MVKPQYILCLTLLLASTSPAIAEDKPDFIILRGGNAQGDGQPGASNSGKATLLAFWRSDCAPCVLERPILTSIAEAHPTLTIALVPLDGDAYTQRHFPLPSAPNMEVWLSNADVETTLLRMGDTKRALPFSVFLRKDGSACETHYGLLGTDLVDEWMKQC